MIRLRPYKQSDSKEIVNWISDEKEFVMWCANKLNYPLTVEQLNALDNNFKDKDNTWFITAVDEIGNAAGYFMITLVDYINNSAHLGFVIINPKLRNLGLGKEMISLAVKYANDILKVKKVTLNVFDNNDKAYRCYKKIGFETVSYTENSIQFEEEVWGCYHMNINYKLVLE